MFLPRLARVLHHPALAVALGAIIIVVAVIGLASDNMPAGWAILIIVVGLVNVLRGVVRGDETSD